MPTVLECLLIVAFDKHIVVSDTYRMVFFCGKSIGIHYNDILACIECDGIDLAVFIG